MSGERRYYCKVCGYREKWIPGRDSELSRTIRTGCPECEIIRTFEKVGVGP